MNAALIGTIGAAMLIAGLMECRSARKRDAETGYIFVAALGGLFVVIAIISRW